jgi:hypothetical protein
MLTDLPPDGIAITYSLTVADVDRSAEFYSRMNAGIGDAVALAAALDTAIEHDSTGPLAAYSATRRPVAQQIVAVTDWLTWLATMGRQRRGLRNAILATLGPSPAAAWPGGCRCWPTADN